MSTISTLMVALAGPIAKKALQALGIGVVSYAAVQVAFNAAQSQLISLLGQASGSIIWIADRAGMLAAIGIILGALAAKFGLQAIGKLGRIAA